MWMGVIVKLGKVKGSSTMSGNVRNFLFVPSSFTLFEKCLRPRSVDLQRKLHNVRCRVTYGVTVPPRWTLPSRSVTGTGELSPCFVWYSEGSRTSPMERDVQVVADMCVQCSFLNFARVTQVNARVSSLTFSKDLDTIILSPPLICFALSTYVYAGRCVLWIRACVLMCACVWTCDDACTSKCFSPRIRQFWEIYTCSETLVGACLKKILALCLTWFRPPVQRGYRDPLLLRLPRPEAQHFTQLLHTDSSPFSFSYSLSSSSSCSTCSIILPRTNISKHSQLILYRFFWRFLFSKRHFFSLFFFF